MAVARNHVGPNDDISVVLLREDVPANEFAAIEKDRVYQRYVTAYTKELEENGFSFAAKCRILAEDAIQSMYDMSKNEEMPAAARVKAVENLVEWGGLAAPKIAQDGAGTGGFHITFNLPASPASSANTIDTSTLSSASPSINVTFAPPSSSSFSSSSPSALHELPEVTYVKTSVLPFEDIAVYDPGYSD